MRPYILDYYIPRKMPKFKQLRDKTKFITQKLGGRDFIFRLRNAILKVIIENRKTKKSMTLLERVMEQI